MYFEHILATASFARRFRKILLCQLHFILVAARTTTMPPVAIKALTMSSSGQETSCELRSIHKPHAKWLCGFSL
jgi:hypothetical protein